MSAEQKRTVRCAIYTRKSSEEGLEQSFNSLNAQREACQAYILSQRQEGWRAVETHYDDGGYSGGSLERPALKCLLLSSNGANYTNPGVTRELFIEARTQARGLEEDRRP